MNEGFLYFIWENLLFGDRKQKTLTGEDIEILNTGRRNKTSGPDFFDARIKINGILWAGNVEVHVKSSDWILHGHDNDPAYRNVILHVVYEHDLNINQTSGTIPVLQLDFSRELYIRYKKLVTDPNPVHCSGKIEGTEPFRIKSFLNSVALERLCEKTEAIKEILKGNKNNFEETFYRVIARNFGFHVNSVPFGILAGILPVKFIARHRNSLLQTEALLFGQAGLLNDELENEYFLKLKEEYSMLSVKFGLQPMDPVSWKFSHVRPGNFPTIRIAQFAALLHRTFPLFSSVIEAESPEKIEDIIRVEPSEFWKYHYSFTSEAEPISRMIGRSSFHIIVINTIAPFLYLYGEIKEEEKYCNMAVELLESVPPESNSIISTWKKEKVIPECALETQALIQLFNKYCTPRKCLECTIGSLIVKGK